MFFINVTVVENATNIMDYRNMKKKLENYFSNEKSSFLEVSPSIFEGLENRTASATSG